MDPNKLPEEVPKDGNMPQYIKNVPWYVDNKSAQSLNHQKFLGDPKKADINEWYERGKKGYQATNYRKGACENCGAMGHKKKQCTERPRKTGVKFDLRDIAPDDMTKEVVLDWEGKRDRWSGFDAQTHKDIVADEYEVYEEIKKKRKLDENDSEFKDTHNPIEVAQLPSKYDPISQKTQGLANIRNREDRPNYLLNLDPNSAAYNPKSRIMPENPNPLLPEDKQLFKGHNAYLNSGEQLTLLEQERFVQQQAQLQNSQLNSVALPSLTEHVYKTVKRKTQMANSGRMGQLLNKYGGKQYIQNKPDEVMQNQNYLEYTREGKVKKQILEELGAKSRYPENVYINDHTSVWGSWWNEHLGWGYACCHNTTKMSMCSGARGHELALQRQTKVKKEKLRQQMQQKIRAEQAKQQ